MLANSTTRCQKKHWSKHKAFCNMVQGKGPKNAYLSRMKTPEEVFRVLIDSYRLRVQLDHAHQGEDHGMYFNKQKGVSEGLVWVAGDANDDFQKYLDLAEDADILPEWWRFENRMECLAEAVDEENEDNIVTPIDEENLVTRYEGDMSVRNALCIVAELVVGYDGKGRAKDDTWYTEFQEYLDLHPQERAKLVEGTVQAVKNAGVLPVQES